VPSLGTVPWRAGGGGGPMSDMEAVRSIGEAIAARDFDGSATPPG
jgi:hypothetical protein